MLSEGEQFCSGWDIAHSLGEGAFSEVKLLISRTNGSAVAVKVIDMQLCPAVNSAKEVKIMSMLCHPNIIRLLGERIDPPRHFIFMEYASGGELFDRIEPDVGMPQALAQKYFRELINGVEYLHEKGIAHRDLKPENILLGEHDELKITDFGMATVFRHQGVERTLTSRCGTMPYVAPEVLTGHYKAEPADVWSCGIILVTLLAGELPWDEPTAHCQRFLVWKDKYKITQSPWKKMDSIALSLLRGILQAVTETRMSIAKIKQHRWFVKDFERRTNETGTLRQLSGMDINDTASLSKFFLPSFGHFDTKRQISADSFPNSQPVAGAATLCSSLIEPNATSFSQPTKPENLLLPTQSQLTPGPQDPYQRLVKRMTRFFATVSCDEAFAAVTELCERLKYTWKKTALWQATVTTRDRRRKDLSFKLHVCNMSGPILVDFRLSKGDGIEFKHIFVKLRAKLRSIVRTDPLPGWPPAAVRFSQHIISSQRLAALSIASPAVAAPCGLGLTASGRNRTSGKRKRSENE